jgi:hypothetical protein
MAQYSQLTQSLSRTFSRQRFSRKTTAESFSANAALNLVRRFDPIAGFDWHSLASIAQHAQELRLPAGRVLVRRPRRLQGVWYLSAGVLVDEVTGLRFVGGSARCRLPVYPGNTDLRSCTPVRLVFFGDDHLSLLMPQLVAAPVKAERKLALAGGAERWLDALAASPLLRLLYQRRGAAGWQSWLRELESLAIDNSQPLIEKGDEGDYFYIVQSGTAVVADERELARIGAGGFFGEDALLSGQRRNARVHMPGGGRVLRGSSRQLCGLVDDLWWALARKPESWQCDNQLLSLRSELPTQSLRNWLARLPVEHRYGLAVGSELLLQDLLLLLLVHRGYFVVLREQDCESIPC